MRSDLKFWLGDRWLKSRHYLPARSASRPERIYKANRNEAVVTAKGY